MRWLAELQGLYESRAASAFVLHGNVRDLFPLPASAHGQPGAWVSLEAWLQERLLRGFDISLTVEFGRGITVERGREHLPSEVAGALPAADAPTPVALLRLLDQVFLYWRNVAVTRPELGGRHVALVLTEAQTFAPREAGALSPEVNAAVALLRHWARGAGAAATPGFSLTLFLLTESLPTLHGSLASDPHVAAIAVGQPEAAELAADLRTARAQFPLALAGWEGQEAALAERLRGLPRHALLALLRRQQHQKAALSSATLGQLRRTLLEREAGGLLEVLDSNLTLDACAGLAPALRESLRADLALLRQGGPVAAQAAPKGYLVCGPVGTGKTFLVKCLAGEAGLPALVLRNFRDKWVGSSEANLEKIFRLLDGIGQALVFVDEADQALGKRQAGAEGGAAGEVSGRLYGMLAQFMSEPRYRGRLLWILATSRPDEVEVDLKRPGRVDVKLPLFPALSAAEGWALLRHLARAVSLGELPEAAPETLVVPELLTPGGAETICTTARRRMLLQPGEDAIGALGAILAAYQPPVARRTMLFQMALAVRESSSRAYLPEALGQFLPPEVLAGGQ